MTGVQTCALPILLVASHLPEDVKLLGAKVFSLGQPHAVSEGAGT